MNFRETALGFEAELPGFLFFFGKKEASSENLSREYPGLLWARVRQTHSDRVLESPHPISDELREGDAHHSRSANLALLISTADCIPALIADPERRIVASVHAGWRGVEQRILPKTVEALMRAGSKPADLVVALGPHIAFSSFEVGDDVRNVLLLSAGDVPHPELTRPLPAGKSLVNLRALARQQLEALGIRRIEGLEFDTKTDPRFHSHRRDRENAGRQLSFVCRRE